MNADVSEIRRFSLLFEEPLTDQATCRIAERLKCERVTRLMRARQKHRERKDSFGRLSAAVAFFRGLEAIAQEADNGVLEFIDRWPVSYFLSKNYGDGPNEELAYGRLAVDLLHSALPNGTSPLAGLTFETRLERDGALLALGRGGRLFLRGVTGSSGSLIWRCSERTAIVTDISDPRRKVEIALPLPLADVSLAAFRPNSVAKGFQIPILDDGADVLFTSGYSPDHEDKSPSNNTATDEPLTLANSLGKAHDTLAEIWPDVIPWAKALVPAVADMGRRDPGAARLSGSFAPGEPIYLTRITKPLFHAEDLIHEIQHLRFALTVPADEWFGRWNEEEEMFISPYRADLRPIAGIHLGLHAFVAVTEFGLRTINQPSFGQVGLKWLYDTHLRNLFAFHTIAKYEKLSSDGKSYYREMGTVLAKQHARIYTMMRLAQQEKFFSLARGPMSPASERATAINASIDIGQLASTTEISSGLRLLVN
jgi:HEXXH motif-containing protein